MLRVCGITYDHTNNYGSCLQAYALQKAIENTKLSNGSNCSYQLIPIKTFKEYNHLSMSRLIILPLLRLHHSQFSPFEREFLRFAPVTCLQDLPQLNENTDAFICGSDVIWNPDQNLNLSAFYLDFAKKYKFSYAASYGKAEITDQLLTKVRPYLEEFDAISVREASGAEVVRRCVNKTVRIVSDPVLLLNKDEWNSLIPQSAPEKGCIFVYITHLSKALKTFLDVLQRKTGLRIVYAAAGPKQALKQGMLQVQKPQRWLQQLRDAEYVVTNSFHATAFSVMFHKKFFTVVNGDKAKGINVRMNDFLNSLGLGDRIFSSVPEEIDVGEVNYSGVDEKIATLREKSLSFLRENLEAAYRQKMELEAKQQ